MKTMREWMRDRRVAAALAALAVLLAVYRLVPKGAPQGPVASPPPAQGTGQAQGVPAPQSPMPAVEASAPPARPAGGIAWSWGKNPFLPQWKERGAGEIAAGAAGSGNRLAPQEVPSGLRGTVISGDSGIAIFGSRLVPVGGKIGEWTVERVDPYGVSLRKGKEVRVVELFKPAPSGVKDRGGDR